MQELVIGQGDHNGTVVVVKVTDGGAAFDLSGYDVFFEMLLPDRETYYRKAGVAERDVATFTIDERYAGQVPGDTKVAYVSIEDGENLVASTERISVHVERSARYAAEVPETWMSGIDETIAAMKAADDAADGAAAAARLAMQAATEGAESAAAQAAIAAEKAQEADAKAQIADDAASNADEKASVATAAAEAATSAAAAAATATKAANIAAAAAVAAVQAVDDLVQLSVPVMSDAVHGGAKVGEGLVMVDGALTARSYVEYETVGSRELPTLVIIEQED